MKTFRGRIAVVTGAASGIGFALAKRFADEGMKVVLADVEESALERAERDLRSAGAQVLAVRTNVSRAADVDALAEKTLGAFGAVHVICNNAGVGGDTGPVWEQSLENWEWVLGVNLWGVIHGIRSFVPILLRQNDEGHVVNTASMAGHLSMPLGSVYDATKFAVVTISESLYHELTGSKVKVSVLCPGFVSTNIIDSDRNRPPELRTDRPTSEFERSLREAFRTLVAAGIPPSDVAERVFQAIRDERFYVFPHPELLASVRSRMENILAERNPTLDLPEEMRAQMKM